MTTELNRYLASLSETARRGSYATFAKKFDSYAKGKYDKAIVQKFVKQLQKDGYADGSVDFAFRLIRRFYRLNNFPWEFNRLEGPVIRQDEIRQVALEPKLVEQMIMAAKDSKLTPEERVFLALGTTYGLRREELADLESQDIDLKNKTLFVQTIKHGRQRYHLIPDEIVPYISIELPQITVGQATQIFHSIERKSYGVHISEAGWHSTRRGLVTGLKDNGVSEDDIHSFLRWRSSSMVSRYTITRYMGLEGERVVLSKSDQEVDRRVFAKHPFLHLWAK